MATSTEEGNAAVSGGEQGASAGAAAGPWGAVVGGLLGTGAGLISANKDLPTIDMSALLQTINSSGQYQRQLINSLPDEIKQNLLQYTQQMGAAGAQYQTAIQGLSDSLQSKSASIYGPNSDAANAAKTAAKKDIYSTLPGTQNAIRNALAATGGLGRGQAGASLAAPAVQAAQQYGKAATDINTTQTQQAQGAQMQALQTATSMDASMFQQMFGMSKEQAQQILTSGNQTLRDQLAQLIAQSNTQTGQILSAQGVAANNGYQNGVTRNAQQDAIYSGLAQTGTDLYTAMSTPGSGNGGSGGGTSTSPYADLNYNYSDVG